MRTRRVVSSTKVLQARTRLAAPADAPEVLRLLTLLGDGGSEEGFVQFLAGGGEAWVATMLGQVVGLAVLEWLRPLQHSRATATLTALVTDPLFRHRGIARALLSEATRRVRQAGADCLMIACATERDEVRAFLAAAGFEPRLIVFQRAA